MPEPITVVHAEHLNPQQVAISFSDGTMAVFEVNDLLAYAPRRTQTSAGKADG